MNYILGDYCDIETGSEIVVRLNFENLYFPASWNKRSPIKTNMILGQDIISYVYTEVDEEKVKIEFKHENNTKTTVIYLEPHIMDALARSWGEFINRSQD